MNRLHSAGLRFLPTGHSLPHDSWIRRHKQISALLWLHVLVVPVFALLRRSSLSHAALEGALVGLFAILASHRPFSKNVRSVLATLGLVSSSAVLTHLSGGMIEAHFHFFVVVVVISLYQSWVPFIIGVGFVALHHGIAGAIDPASVFNHPAALERPWLWALVHACFILAESVACLVTWRVNEDALDSERDARAALKRANDRLAEAQAVAGVGSWAWNIPSGTAEWSAELFNIAGRDPQHFAPVVGSFLELVHPDDRSRVAAVIEAAGATQADMEFECRIVRADGSTAVIHVLGQCVTAEDGALANMVGTVQDITQRKVLEQEIQHRAFHDSLTGLVNRAQFTDRITNALAARERSGTPLHVLFVDLDDFKTVNDTLGHGIGDGLLVEFSQRLLAAVRTSDTVARLGGDEFAVLLEDTDTEGACDIAGRVQEAVLPPAVVQGHELSIRTSIGVARAEPSAQASDVLRDADIAMYAAKRDGKGCSRVFRPEMRSSALTQMQPQAALKDALTPSSGSTAASSTHHR